jgi:hypothetical protein
MKYCFCFLLNSISDSINHTPFMAQSHIRIMSVTIILLSFRLLKITRVIFTKFGYLVVIIFTAVPDIFYWVVFYAIVWLGFCKSQIN